MEDFEKTSEENRISAPRFEGGGKDEGNDRSADSVWEELRSRREKARRRIGEGWERVSENAQRYADDHSIGVALGSLGVGLAVGILLGAMVARD